MNKKLEKGNSFAMFCRNHWLMLLIILQPLLDIIAFWTKNPDGTLAGYVRLIIMLVLPVCLLFILPEKKQKLKLAAAMGVIAVFCLAHILNVMRVGPTSLIYEISYTAKTAQMPILAVCFIFAVRNTQTRNQAYWGLFFAAAVTALALGLSVVTQTANVTYGEGLGVSGWVIDDNRTANSTILVVLSAFAVFCAVKSDKKIINIVVPVLTAIVLMTNGTMTCYLSIFVIFLGFAVFLPLEKRIRGCAVNKLAVLVLVAVAAASALAYPLTPKYKIKQAQNSFMEKTENEFVSDFDLEGYDLSAVTPDDILNNPQIHTIYEDYYWKCLWILSPDMFERYDIDEIMAQYDYTIDATILLNTRNLKKAYVRLMWDHSDLPTKLFGIDCSSAWYNGKVDLENDWPAIFYYYGYLGFAAYCAFVLYFAWLILRRLIKDFKNTFTADNFIIFISYLLLLGIAEYSGAVLRRPNVSFYLSLVLGLIYYQTVTNRNNQLNGWRGEWI